MFGIASPFSIDLSDLEYSSDIHKIRFRIKTEPDISELLQDPLGEILPKSLPFLKLNGDTLEVSIEDSSAAEILEELRMENNIVTLKINLRRKQ